jgi:hypothetical protein
MTDGAPNPVRLHGAQPFRFENAPTEFGNQGAKLIPGSRGSRRALVCAGPTDAAALRNMRRLDGDLVARGAQDAMCNFAAEPHRLQHHPTKSRHASHERLPERVGVLTRTRKADAPPLDDPGGSGRPLMAGIALDAVRLISAEPVRFQDNAA